MADINGKAIAINVVTPRKPWRSWIMRLIFWVVANIIPGRLKGLNRLSFIYFARWVILPRRSFPRLSEQQPEEKLRYDYYFFESNYNGSWDQYIDAFSDAIPSGLNAFWQGSIGYPKSRPITPFKKYIRFNEIDTDYYFCAYPSAATNDIKSAIRLKAKLDQLAKDGAGMNAASFARAYQAFLIDVQNNLGGTGPESLLSVTRKSEPPKRPEGVEQKAFLPIVNAGEKSHG